MSSLLELPTELLIEILSLCSSTDIKRVCETCHQLYAVGMPELYRVIDLSSHTASIDCEPVVFGPHRVPPDFIDRRWNRIDLHAFERQLEFTRTIEHNPGLAGYARELRWTVMSLFQRDGAWDEAVLEGEVERVRAEHHDSSMNTDDAGHYEWLWRIFSSLSNVSKLDIWIEYGDHLLLPPPCFPKATSIRLSGCMTRDLVERFMQNSTGILERLELHNLLQCEEHEPPFPKFNDAHTLETYLANHGPDHRTIAETQRMVGALEPFIGRFAVLTSLCIATFGETRLDCLPDERDDRRFTEWARMISSVCQTLRFLSFKQGRSRNVDECPRGSRPGRTYGEYRPMDQLFRQWIMPVLLAGSWPRIKRMEICGVGQTVRSWCSSIMPEQTELAVPGVYLDVKQTLSGRGEVKYECEEIRIAFPYEKREELSKLLPDGADLIVEEEQERDYEFVY